MLVMQLQGFEVEFGGEEPLGWLAPGAAPPPPSERRLLKLDFEIVSVDSGFELRWTSERNEAPYSGDTWHESLEDALDQAEREFGITFESWDRVAND